MDNVLGMEVPDAKTNVDEYFPDNIVYERFVQSFLFTYKRVEVTECAVLKYYVYLLIVNEGVEIANYIW